jgi:starvation-inducible outer membrane lipoprotein
MSATRKIGGSLALAAAITLAGCTTVPQRHAEKTTARTKSTAETIETCEQAVYYSPQYDRQTALNCANVLDVWQ